VSIAIPAKCAVSQMIDYLKDKSAIHLARMCGEHKRNFFAQCPCARGYFASTVDRDAAMIREYIKNQEQEDQRLDHLNVWS
jgi:putative transposase